MTSIFLCRVLAPLAAVQALAADCIPPSFYTNPPRDREWYYGTARHGDTEKARDEAVRNLGKQVTGDLSGWSDANVAKLAGPGHDRRAVAEAVESAIVQSPVAGWEDDDHERCGDFSYVLVRVRKSQAQKFLKENRDFQASVVAALDKRVGKIEVDVEDLKAQFAKMRAEMANWKDRTPQDTADKSKVERLLAGVSDDLARGRATPETKKRIEEATGAFADLQKRLDVYQESREAAKETADQARFDFLKAEAEPRLPAMLEKMRTEPIDGGDYLKITTYLKKTKQHERLHSLSHDILKWVETNGAAASTDRLAVAMAGGKPQAEMIKRMAMHDSFRMAQELSDEAEMVKDGEAFLQAFNEGHVASSVERALKHKIRMAGHKEKMAKHRERIDQLRRGR